MKRLLTYAGALMVASASLGEVPLVDLWPERQAWQDLGFIAALAPRLTTRDWVVTAAVLAFVAVNMFLWTLPISQTALFLISLPTGLAALVAFMWFAPNK